MKIHSSFSEIVFLRIYVQTEGQRSEVLQTHRSVSSESLQAILLTNFFPVPARVKIYLHIIVF